MKILSVDFHYIFNFWEKRVDRVTWIKSFVEINWASIFFILSLDFIGKEVLNFMESWGFFRISFDALIIYIFRLVEQCSTLNLTRLNQRAYVP